MKISEDHFYHGAALIQIAEHRQFTAINSLELRNRVLRTAYKINNDIGIYLKYAKLPTETLKEYNFTFHKDQLTEIDDISHTINKFFIALVCVEDREICCISYDELNHLIDMKMSAKNSRDDQYSILVRIVQGERLHVYVSTPGTKRKKLPGELVIPRNGFPNKLFS